MKKVAVFSLLAALLLENPAGLLSQYMTDYQLYTPEKSYMFSEKDSTRPGNVKVNFVKLLFNEISLSYEHFRKPAGPEYSVSGTNGSGSLTGKRKKERARSLNFNLGLLYPSDLDNMIQFKQDIHYLFIFIGDIESSPYINTGLSTQVEFRNYRNHFYYGPQIMEKLVFFGKTYLDNKSGSTYDSWIRLQSGHASVTGLGYFIGSEFNLDGLILDMYLCLSGRIKLGRTTIYEEETYWTPNWILPEPEIERNARAYPLVNMGIRLGFSL